MCQCQIQRADTELTRGKQSSVYPPQGLDKCNPKHPLQLVPCNFTVQDGSYSSRLETCIVNDMRAPNQLLLGDTTENKQKQKAQ